MGLLDLFDEAFDLYKSNFTLLLLITSIVYVPLVVADAYVAGPALSRLSGSAGDLVDGVAAIVRAAPLTTAVVVAVSALSLAILLCALVAAASARYRDEPVNPAGAYRMALPAVPAAASVLTIFVLGAATGYSTLVLPGLVLSVAAIPLQLFVHVMVNEGNYGLLGPLTRSWRLVEGHGSFILAGHLVHWLLWSILVAAIVGGIDVIATCAVDSAAPFLPLLALHKEVAESIALGLSCLLLLPFQICVVTMFYFDLRIRKEGYDIELLARSLGYPVPTAGAPKASGA